MTRPYTTHTTDNVKGTRALMAWLQEIGGDDADPVGVAIDDEQIALAQGDKVYLIRLSESDFFSQAALAAAIMGAAPPRLVAIDAEETLVRLTNTLAPHYPTNEFFHRLAACMLGDLQACIRTADHLAPPRGLPLPDQAYTARLLEPQYQWEAPKYYFAVSVPLARIRAEWRLFGMGTPADWWVSYPDLWLRSLLHYTGDPTLSWLFGSGEDPAVALSRMFELTLETTRAVLVWHICGRSIDAMGDVAPELIDRLPDNLPEVGDLWNKRMPSLWLGITQLMGSYQRDRLARTLYGRKFRGNRHPGAASAFTILGTVQDILEVAAVTFHNNRPSPAIMIKGVDSNPLSSVARVLGAGPRNAEEYEQWLNDLRPLATLAEPLAAIRLEATIVDGGASQGAPASEALTSASDGALDMSPTTPNPAVGGSTLTGTIRSTQTRRQTKPKDSAAGRKPSPVTAAERLCGSSPASSRRRSSKGRT